MDDFILQPGFDLAVPSMADYFGLWMVDPDQFRPLVSRVNGTNLHLHIQSDQAAHAIRQQNERTFQVTDDGVAVFRIEGPTMKRASSMSGGTSTIRLRSQLKQARTDPAIVGAMLVMDTPGGTAKGNEDMAKAVAKFAATKPIIAFVDDMTASAGVSVASQACEIWANNDAAMYGAMGTYAALVDSSGMAEKLGIEVLVIKAGDYKGMGEPGTKITEEQLQEAQRIVNRLNESYLSMIASGRKRTIDSIRPLADGRVIFADDAKAAGLIDRIGPFTQAVSRLKSLSGSSVILPVSSSNVSKPIQKGKPMEPATLEELQQKFPNASADWVLSQLKTKSTIVDAAVSYASHVEEQAAQRAKADEEKHASELAAAKAEAAKQSGSTGFQPLTIDSAIDDGEQTGDPVEDFDGATVAHMNRYNCDRRTAVNAVRRKHPRLAQAYLLATNTGQRQQRELKERFDGIKV